MYRITFDPIQKCFFSLAFTLYRYSFGAVQVQYCSFFLAGTKLYLIAGTELYRITLYSVNAWLIRNTYVSDQKVIWYSVNAASVPCIALHVDTYGMLLVKFSSMHCLAFLIHSTHAAYVFRLWWAWKVPRAFQMPKRALQMMRSSKIMNSTAPLNLTSRESTHWLDVILRWRRLLLPWSGSCQQAMEMYR